MSIMIKIGQGFDVHALVPGRNLIIGGVHIPHPYGLLGHSDGDVLLHAICDALLGAAGLGDIGQHFPDSDDCYRGADSLELLRDIGARVLALDWDIANIDTTIIAQAPKMAPHVAGMVSNIAQALKLTPSQVNVKAKTTEHLGFVGRTEGIAAQAVALIQRA
ncbi:MAG TPA: 2-C-methyl-D-erythritol 2,4-cyclodiphosphate synthase [Burkholderiales bacterium]|nr:2-C-methyl-D-erythritol 2,4-cyclodiphosphate synthase [Burkholderiales bacterium]